MLDGIYNIDLETRLSRLFLLTVDKLGSIFG